MDIIHGNGWAHLSLDETALVHETYERLARQHRTFVNRDHFFALAARFMRRVAIDHQRHQRAEKRGGNTQPISLDASDTPPATCSDPSPQFDTARFIEFLERRAEHTTVRIVKLRVFDDLLFSRIQARLLGDRGIEFEDEDLRAYLLGPSARLTVLDQVRALLEHFGGLQRLCQLPARRFTAIEGLTPK